MLLVVVVMVTVVQVQRVVTVSVVVVGVCVTGARASDAVRRPAWTKDIRELRQDHKTPGIQTGRSGVCFSTIRTSLSKATSLRIIISSVIFTKGQRTGD